MGKYRVEASPSPESNKFNPADFPSGTDILFFDDSSKEWKVGMVNTWADPVKDVDGKLNGNFWVSGSGVGDLKLSQPPKKIDKIPGATVEFDINGKKYSVDITKTNVIQDTHEVELTLVNVVLDANGVNVKNFADVLENINLKTIKNLESVEKFEKDTETRVQKLKTDVLTKADARTKDILVGLTDLQTKIVKVAEQLGALSEWQDIGQAEAEQIGQSIKELQTDINTDLADLENKLKNLGARKDGKNSSSDEADGLQTRLDRETKNKAKKNIEDHKTAMENAKTIHDIWKKDKAEWDKKKKAKEDWDKMVDKKGKPDPGDPGTEPAEPPKPESIKSPEVDQAKIDAAFDLFTALETSTATLTATDKFKQIIKKVKDLADKQAKREGLGDYTKYDNDTKKEVIAMIFQEVLNKEKGSEVVEAEKFDLEKEKNELKTKIKEIMARAEAAGVAMPVGKTVEQVTNERLADIASIVPGTPPRTQAEQEKDILDQWNLIRTQELKVFEAEQKKAPKTEKAEVEKDIDIPDSLLMELLMTKRVEVQAAMKELYSGLLNLGSADNKNIKMLDAVKDIFGSEPPDQAMRNKLAEHGIRNWNTFKKSWDKKLHIQVAAVLNEWAKGQLKNRAQSGGMINFLKNNGGSALINMGMGLGLTYGGAQLGGWIAGMSTKGMEAGVGKTAINIASKIGGGSLAGVAKAGFHKLTGGFFARKQEVKAQSGEEKAIDALIKDQFNPSARDKNGQLIPATGMADFSSILAQSLRDISGEAVSGDAKDFTSDKAKELKGDARRIYINHLKKMRAEGKDVTEQMQLSLAISCQELMGNLEIKQERFSTPEHLGIITTIEEGQKYLGYKKGVVAGALVGAGVTTAFVGAAQLGANYVPILSGVLGAAGGMTMGYRMADKWHEGSKMKSGKKNFTALFEQTNNVFAQYQVDKDAKIQIGKKEKSANDVLMENIQRINRLLKGKADSESDLEMMQYLNSDPNLLARAKNLLYESHRSGLFAEQALQKLQEQAEKMKKDAETVEFSKTKKQAIRALGAIVGGAVVGGISMSVGFAFAQHRLDSLTEQKIEANGKVFSTASTYRRALVDIAVAANAPKVENPIVPAAPAEITPGTPAISSAEAAPHHPAGLIEAPNKVTGVDDWRHQVMEKMGYKFHGGKIDHALRFHPGAKIVLMHHNGTPVMDTKGHAVEYTFKRGGSTWDALDHLQNKANGLIKAGEVPTIKIEGADAGKVEVLDNYKVESHSGGKTQMVEGGKNGTLNRAVIDGVEKNNGVVKLEGVKDLSDIPTHSGDRMTTLNGQEYNVMPIRNDDEIFTAIYEHDNHIYDETGKYIGEQYTPTESHASKTSWSSGGAIADKHALEAMLKGTAPGGAAEVATPQPGTPKGGGTVEAGKSAEAAAVVDKSTAAPTVEAKAVAPAPATPEVAPVEVPKNLRGFVGHETIYSSLEAAKGDFSNLQPDAKNIFPELVDKLEKLLSDNPKVLDNPKVNSILSSSNDLKVQSLAGELEKIMGKKWSNFADHVLTKEEQLFAGHLPEGKFDEISVDNGAIKGTYYVAKDHDCHAYMFKPEKGDAVFSSDPEKIFYKDKIGRFIGK